MSAAENIAASRAKGNNASPTKIDANKPTEEDNQDTDGAFFSLVRGNNLTLNDYI